MVKAWVSMGLRPNIVSLRASILRWTHTLQPAMLVGTFDICASLELSMDSGTVEVVLADAAQALQVGCRTPLE